MRVCKKTNNTCINGCGNGVCYYEGSPFPTHINIESKPVNDNNVLFRLGEDKILEEFNQYIDNTYSQHYAGNRKDSRQTIEAIIDRGHGEGFCIGNAMKYLERYGFKNGKNRDDLMKAMHYCMLALINHDKTINK